MARYATYAAKPSANISVLTDSTEYDGKGLKRGFHVKDAHEFPSLTVLFSVSFMSATVMLGGEHSDRRLYTGCAKRLKHSTDIFPRDRQPQVPTLVQVPREISISDRIFPGQTNLLIVYDDVISLSILVPLWI